MIHLPQYDLGHYASWLDDKAAQQRPDLGLWTSGTSGLLTERQLPRGLPPVQSSILLDSAKSLGSAVRCAQSRWIPTAPRSRAELNLLHPIRERCHLST